MGRHRLAGVAVNPVSSGTPQSQPRFRVFWLQSPQECPQILPSPLAPMPTGGSQSIPVHLASAAFFQVSGGRAPCPCFAFPLMYLFGCLGLSCSVQDL